MAAIVVIGGYLLGSVSSAYLAGRWLKGIDLRQYGSTTVSGSGVFQHVSFGAGIAVGIFDIAKGTLPTWIALRFDLGLPVALAAGTAALIGHNWPLYLGFHGGRGIGTSIGMLLVVFPWGVLWLLLFLAIGHLIRWGALAALAGMATLPALPWFVPRLTEHPTEVTWAAMAILLVGIAKRLEANRLPLPPPGRDRQKVLLFRFLFDRDVGPREEWQTRTPDEVKSPSQTGSQ